MERLGLGGGEMTSSGHSKDFVLKVVQPSLVGLMDGTLTGRGSPVLRGFITGVATFVGGILHTLPFLLPQVGVALYVAFGIVGFELLAISFIRYRYFNMSFVMSAVQVVLGGALVFASGVLIGSA